MHMRLLMALSYVRDHDNAPQQELAEALCMDANNVVLLLNELEDLGFVARRRDPHDRRRHLVELTEEGRERAHQRRACAGNDRGRRAAGARPEPNARPYGSCSPVRCRGRARRARACSSPGLTRATASGEAARHPLERLANLLERVAAEHRPRALGDDVPFRPRVGSSRRLMSSHCGFAPGRVRCSAKPPFSFSPWSTNTACPRVSASGQGHSSPLLGALSVNEHHAILAVSYPPHDPEFSGSCARGVAKPDALNIPADGRSDGLSCLCQDASSPR